MTASADRRRRFTILGAVLGGLGVVALVVISVVAVTTLRSSTEGRAPDVETRPVVAFPETPNALVGIVDDLDRLTSIAVLTLDPSGVGGSVVVVPVNVDQTDGFGPERLPVSRQPYLPGDEAQTAELVSEIEPLLTLTIERGQVVGPDELEELLEPFGPFEVDLTEAVVDSDTTGSGQVARRGSSTLNADEMTEALTAIDASDTSYSHHATDVELWEAIAAAADTDAEVPIDDDRPVAPATFAELWDRLFAGDVGVRPLDIHEAGAQAAENETDADFVIVERADALVVFGAVSPGLVLTPNDALNVSLVVGFDPDEVAALGETADGVPVTKTSMTRRFVKELLFGQANIVGVDLADTPDEVPAVTQLRIADESMENAARGFSERFFGDAEVVVAEELLDGVDVVVVLGANFLEQRAELLAEEHELADAAEEENQRADFDVSGVDTDGSSGTPDTDLTPVPDTTSDTVADDG